MAVINYFIRGQGILISILAALLTSNIFLTFHSITRQLLQNDKSLDLEIKGPEGVYIIFIQPDQNKQFRLRAIKQ